MTTTPIVGSSTDARVRYQGFDALYVGGVWRSGGAGQYTDDLDPWTGRSIARIARGTVEDVQEALESAKDAQRGWAKTSPGLRAQVMRTAGDILTSRKQEFIDWSVREVGSTVGKAEVEWEVARGEVYEAASMSYHVTGQILPSDVPGKENRVYRAPLGVIAVISPWNFPLNLTTRSVAPAIALGNSVVLKPSEESPVTGGLFLAKVFEEAGVPAGVLQVVTHAREDAGVIGDAITTSPIPKFVSFTGSTNVGKGITRKAGIKRLALELGGNAPIVVLADADLDQAVDGATFSAFHHQGQICMSGNRLIVEAPIFDRFVERFVEKVRSLPVGNPADPSTFIGPVINQRQLDGILDKLERARQSGAKHILGGEPTGPSGLLLPPQIIVGDNSTPTAAEEVFGPVITVIRAEDEADALRIANATDYGLSSAVFTGDLDRGVVFAQQIEAGMTHVNDASPAGEAHVAFGGEKNSGLGRFGGQWVLEEFTTVHWISVQRTQRRYFG
nr:aldehyde dehydrogenase family protein [Streptomyces sp. NBC_00886]